MASALLACVLVVSVVADTGDKSSFREGSTIGYSTVADALADLTSRPDNSVRVQDGWTIINDQKNHTIWSFTPKSHPAYPAAIQRTIIERDGAVYIDMNALCEAPKAACDELIDDFKRLNEKVRERLRPRTGQQP